MQHSQAIWGKKPYLFLEAFHEMSILGNTFLDQLPTISASYYQKKKKKKRGGHLGDSVGKASNS